MFEPDSRALLSELLQPPLGFRLEHAVGTTFTLNLESALSVPLAFASTRTGEDDRIGVLNALREAADRVEIFAQAGNISLPRMNDLVALLEPMVHPIGMVGRLFHPKVWFLEFSADDERRYRFISSSRNLTDDVTWDAVVTLDGRPTARVDASLSRKNEAMAALLEWLPGNTVQRMPPTRAQRIRALAAAWRSIQWEHPPEAHEVDVHVLGIGRGRIPIERGRQALLVSPFVSTEGITSLRARPGGRTLLIARPEQLDRLAPASFGDGLTLHVLDEAATLVDEAGDPQPASRATLTGLHAKVVVHDGPNKSRMLIGSANATAAAWHSNVEVMVDIVGSTRTIGVDATFDAIRPLLEDYQTVGGAEQSEDEAAEWRLEDALRRLANAQLVLRVLQEDPYALELRREDVSDADPLSDAQAPPHIRWHLVTRPDIGGIGLPPAGHPFRSPSLQLREITPFVVLIAEDEEGRTRRTVLVARLEDDVPERRDAIIASQLTSPEAFARFLRLLLEPGATLGKVDGDAAGSRWAMLGNGVADDGSGFLELLVRAAGTTHDGLDELDRVLRQFSDEERVRAVPAGFDTIWSSVTRARQQLREARDD